MSGLDSTGFTPKTLQVIIEELRAGVRARFGATTRVDAQSVFGHLIGIMAERFADLWELAQALYDSFNVDNAEGILLDNLVALVGLTREPATLATGTVTLSGTDGSTIPVGTIVASSQSGATFVTLEEVEIGFVTPGEVDVDVEAEVAGFLEVAAGEVDQIITPVSGLDSVTNASDFTAGLDRETDSQLRARRERSLQIIGAGTDGAIRANVLALEDITDAVVISNRTLAADSLGIPAKAFRTVVWPDTGVDEERLVSTIFERAPAGIEIDGAVSFDVEDVQGIEHTVKFSYATAIDVGFELDVTTKAGFPSDGEDQVRSAVVAVVRGALESDRQTLQDIVGSGLGIGDDVEGLAVSCAVKTVPGIKSLLVQLNRKTVEFPPTATSDLPISAVEIAQIDDAAADVIVNVL